MKRTWSRPGVTKQEVLIVIAEIVAVALVKAAYTYVRNRNQLPQGGRVRDIHGKPVNNWLNRMHIRKKAAPPEQAENRETRNST